MTGASLTTVPAASPPPHGSDRNGTARARPYFLFAIIAALLAHVVGIGLFRIIGAPDNPVRFPPVYVHYANTAGLTADPALSEQALLFDSEPLFLPTPLNYAFRPRSSEPVHLQPIFADYSPNITPPSEKDFRLQADASAGNLGPLAALRPGQWNFLAAFGQAADHSAQLPPRGALLRVTRLAIGADPDRNPAGRVVLEQTWSATDAPNAGQASLWGPATFLLVFTDSGTIGEPLLINSSGLFSVDDDLRMKLDAYFRSHPLPAGTYQAVVGP
jgi:hypothetical protein